MSKSDKTCTVCGVIFTGGANAMYCPACKRTRKADTERERIENGRRRKIGDIDICEKCGAEYTVKGSAQKYCDNCKPVPHHAKDRPPKIEIVPTKRESTPREPKPIKCATCENVFYSSSGRATYCPDCRIKRKSVYKERQAEKLVQSGRKRIGMERICKNCGSSFVITNKGQKYCPTCREARKNQMKSDVVGVSNLQWTTKWKATYHYKTLGIFDTEAEAIEARKAAENAEGKKYCAVCGKEIPVSMGYYHAVTCSKECRIKYNNANIKQIVLVVSNSMRERIEAEAKANGYTISKYVRELVQKEFDRLDETRGGDDNAKQE